MIFVLGLDNHHKSLGGEKMKKLLLLWPFFALIAGTAFTSTPLCSGSGCNGLDPHTTRCDLQAITWEHRSISNGLVELRFSMSCNTLWGRTTNSTGWHYAQSTLAYWVWWEGANTYLYYRNTPAEIGPGSVVYTAQYYDPVPESAWNACGNLSTSHITYPVLYGCTSH